MINKFPLPITANIITLNEEVFIGDCIKSLQPYFAQIIVVDSLSTDKTQQIAKDLGVEVVEQKYLGDGKQKAVVEGIAKYDWIFSIDADEFIDEGFKEFLENIDLSKEEIAYSVKRKNFVGKHWIKASGFYPDYVTRLYNRKHSYYEKRVGHAKVIAPKVVKTSAKLVHRTYKNYSEWFERMLFISKRDAVGKFNDGKRARKTDPILRSMWAFFKKYILGCGIFRGLDGFSVAITTAFACYSKYCFMIDLQEEKKHKDIENKNK
jgi:glycosyltransferase involved in cell wall biosynthesis